MTYNEYKAIIGKYGHFSLRLDNNNKVPIISDDTCILVNKQWLIPLAENCENVYVYRRKYKDRTFDVTPPPKWKIPVAVSKTSVRVEHSAKSITSLEYFDYWAWALRHLNIVFTFKTKKFPINLVAKQCWDPGILMNPSAVMARGSIELAKREIVSNNTCIIFNNDAYSIHVEVYAPKIYLLKYYEIFVINCKFILKGLEKELKTIRIK